MKRSRQFGGCAFFVFTDLWQLLFSGMTRLLLCRGMIVKEVLC